MRRIRRAPAATGHNGRGRPNAAETAIGLKRKDDEDSAPAGGIRQSAAADKSHLGLSYAISPCSKSAENSPSATQSRICRNPPRILVRLTGAVGRGGFLGASEWMSQRDVLTSIRCLCLPMGTRCQVPITLASHHNAGQKPRSKSTSTAHAA